MRYLLLFSLAQAALVVAIFAANSSADEVQFNRDLRPILSDTCYTCHGPDEKARDSELRLDSKEAALVDLGGYRAIVAGSPKQSELYRRITSDDPDERMPPADSKRQLTDGQIELIRRWIEQGAPWQQHWAFLPPQRARLPALQQRDRAAGGIDAFIAARLEKEQLSPAPEAAKETLIRRATLDLTGLPPTPQQIDAFLADDAPDAYERLVDRLLASPRYGEHMAAAWLDAARYGDTNGYQQDRTRTMWPWRDWVIGAMNANMPVDQFTTEQLAGDLLSDPTPQQMLASGFNRNHMLNGEGGRIAEESRVEYVVDRVETTATVWLGLTAGCGRCHSHKYDPLSQQEFYQFYAFFNNISESGSVDRGGNAAPVMKIPTGQQLLQRRRLQSEIDQLQRQLETPPSEDKYAAWQKETLQRLEASAEAPAWRLLTPAKFASAQGQEIKLLGDGAIFVSGKNPVNDNYTLTLPTDTPHITGIRLEALAHESFTAGGLARSDSGNFVLTEFEIEALLPGEEKPRPVKIKAGQADYEQNGFPVVRAFDGNGQTGWAVHNPNMKLNRTAVFTLAEPIAGGQGTVLTIRLKHESVHKHHNLGQFRLAVTTRERPVIDDKPAVPDGLLAALRTKTGERTAQQQKHVLAYYRQHGVEFAAHRAKLQELQKLLADVDKAAPEVMVMQERGGSPRETFVLLRGQYDQPDKKQPVSPNVPAVFPPLPEGAPANRLGLARWLVDPANPLTARVTVNRYWQHFFGTGLVKTTEDFGSQGELPSHPELLDWLATELVRTGWDAKAMHRLIVTSATYRQSSAASPALLQRDPYNRLLARGPRFRLTSFAIRDQALALAGLLSGQMGGPPVKPYQPGGVWSEFSLGKIKYQRDSGENLYRRSLYTFWRRSVGPTMLFDTSARQVCTVRPSRTNSPLHALTLLNDITYVEAARKFAERIMTEGGDDAQARLTWAFRAATARRPSKEELQVLLRSLDRGRARFNEDAEAASQLLSVGEAPRDAQLDAAELAAYTSVASVILNLDEVQNKE